MSTGRRRLAGEGTIRQRGPNLWEARVSTGGRGNRQRLHATADTMDGALKELARLRRQAGQQRRGARRDHQTVGDLLDYWVDVELASRVDEGTIEQSTVDAYDRHVRRRLKPQLGNYKLRDLDAQTIRRAFRAMAVAGLSPGTRNGAHAALSGALQHAWRDLEIIDANPARKVPLAKVVRVRPPLLPLLDAKRILAVVEHDAHRRLRALWTAAMLVGLRPGEATGLCWDAVDLDDGVLTVSRNLVKTGGGWKASNTKGHKTRYVPLPQIAAAALRDHRKRQMAERMHVGHLWRPAVVVDKAGVDVGGQLVFTSADRPGQPIHREWVRVELGRICARAGVDRLTPHQYLRHGGATLMLALGVDLPTIRDVLGHYSIDMTEVYAHVLPESMRDAATRLDRAFGPDGS